MRNKYSYHELAVLFGKSNLSCGKLSQILDIPLYRVERYLLGDGEAKPVDALRIDAAISVVRSMNLRQPHWDLGELKKYSGKSWDETVGAFNRRLRELAEEQEKKIEDNAANIIVWIICDDADVNEFLQSDDPLKEAGLDRYGKDEFIRHIAEELNDAASML